MSPLLPLLVAALPSQSFAVVVGENRPLDDVNVPLSYADDDAVLTHRLLEDTGAKSRLLVTLDRESARLFPKAAQVAETPTLDALSRALDETFAAIEDAKREGSRTVLYFVYSGHGDVADGEGFVALHRERLTRDFLYEQILARSPADENHVIIDACRSYFLVFGKGPGGRRRPVKASLRAARERFPNTGFVLSTSSDRESHEWARFGGGIFSHEVRSGLRGAADADLDARVTYSELGAFIETANRAVANPKFRPDAVVVPPARAQPESAVLLAWADATGIEVPPEASLGHMVLEDAEGVRLADAHPGPRQALRLRTPARPIFLREFGGTREYLVTESGPVVLTSKQARLSETTGRGAAHLVFRRLFSEPFSRVSVDEYAKRGPNPLTADWTAPPPTAVQTTRRVAPWVLGGAAAVGVALTLTAVVERNRAGGGPQVEAPAANDRIANYNRGAAVSYAIAGATALAWLGIELWLADD